VIRVGRSFKKAESVTAYLQGGKRLLRNPPPQAFRPTGEMDYPAFAHDGEQILPGEWVKGPHDEHVFDTGFAQHRHGIDAIIHKVGEFLRARGIKVPAKDVIQHAIEQFNDNHTHADEHELAHVDSEEWRKLRASVLPAGDSAYNSETNEVTHTRPVRTQGGTKITNYTNKNYQDNQHGRFIESYSNPMHFEIIRALEQLGVPTSEINQGLKFLRYPYLPAEQLVQSAGKFGKVIRNHKPHGNEITQRMRDQSPEGYFGDTEGIFSYENLHHLPDAYFYPVVSRSQKQKSGKPQNFEQESGLYKQAQAMIGKALEQGLDHIPNINVSINTGSIGAPQMINRPLHEILTTPDLRETLIRDMAHAPAMMYLFGRSGQGNTKKLYDHMMDKYGETEGNLSAEEQRKYLRQGEKGGKGVHTMAANIHALARASGKGSRDGYNRFSDHPITEEELKLLGMPYSENLMGQVDRYRTVIEALADHQASAMGGEVKRGLGDIPTDPYIGPEFSNYPEIDPLLGTINTALEPHMDAYMHEVHDFAPTDAFDPSLTQSPGSEVSSPTPISVPSPAEPASFPSAQPGGTFPHTPMQQFQQIRPQIGQFSPDQYREMLEAAGRRRPQPLTDAPLTDVERRSQQAFADPQQTMLSQYYKSMDSVMDDVMKIIKGGRR